MRQVKRSRNNKIAIATGAALAALVSLSASPADAAGFRADYVLDQMTPDQRVSYISGVVEGLAYARFLQDRPDETGMACIYDWYNTSSKENWPKIVAWLERHRDLPVGVLMHTLAKKECGE